MTAEVAIMNTQGVALAADSAVTLGIGKTYNTADKLFALSKYQPVGIMIYGSSSIMGIDWETIIKCYRDNLKNKSFDKLSDYAGDFIKYLAKFPYFTNEGMLKYLKSMCFEVFSNVLSRFIDDLHSEFDGKKDIQLKQIGAVLDKCLKDIKEKIKEVDDEKHLKPDFRFIDVNKEAINEMIKIVFENYELSKTQIMYLLYILRTNFQKCCWVSDQTGIVIAGYGEKEIFPVVYDFIVSGKLGDSLIYAGIEEDQIGVGHTASICPFSQTEMVHQFVRGIAPDFKSIIIDKVYAILDSLSPLINDNDKTKASAISALLEEHLSSVSDAAFKDPILDTVACMQKSELVSMAEAMVNLTALKRHVSTDDESVGGPIDVALITKNDGFIWIKKKTNYDPCINRDLNQNYFRSGKNENV
jgi:20S proteasome alpha/beta subunit